MAIYGVPQFRDLSTSEAGMGGLGDALSNALDTYQQAKTNALNRAVTQQAMEQSREQFPLQLAALKADQDYKRLQFPLQQALLQAQAEYQKQQAASEKFKLDHPGYLGGAQAQLMQYLKDSGALGVTPDGTSTTQARMPEIQKGTSTTTSVPFPSSFAPQSQADASQPFPMMPTGQNALTPPARQFSKIVEPGDLEESFKDQMRDIKSPFENLNFKGAQGAIAKSILEQPYLRQELQRKQQLASAWVHAPQDAKNVMLAEAAGMGVDPSIAVKLFNQGITIGDIAKKRGFDPNNLPAASYLPTAKDRSMLNQRKAALAEMKVIDDEVTEGLGQYSQTYKGYSPAQIWDAFKGKDKEKQIKFLAARALAPEQTYLRLRVAQAETGITAAQEVMEKTMSNVNAFQGLVTPDVYEAAQKRIKDTITRAFSAANKIYEVPSASKAEKNKDVAEGKNGLSSPAQEKIKVQKDGKQYWLPKSQLNDALKLNYQVVK